MYAFLNSSGTVPVDLCLLEDSPLPKLTAANERNRPFVFEELRAEYQFRYSVLIPSAGAGRPTLSMVTDLAGVFAVWPVASSRSIIPAPLGVRVMAETSGMRYRISTDYYPPWAK